MLVSRLDGKSSSLPITALDRRAWYYALALAQPPPESERTNLNDLQMNFHALS